jgi:hypothetical protein
MSIVYVCKVILCKSTNIFLFFFLNHAFPNLTGINSTSELDQSVSIRYLTTGELKKSEFTLIIVYKYCFFRFHLQKF